jgi:hypothetical protein
MRCDECDRNAASVWVGALSVGSGVLVRCDPALQLCRECYAALWRDGQTTNTRPVAKDLERAGSLA